jgi:hypothetical protein
MDEMLPDAGSGSDVELSGSDDDNAGEVIEQSCEEIASVEEGRPACPRAEGPSSGGAALTWSLPFTRCGGSGVGSAEEGVGCGSRC